MQFLKSFWDEAVGLFVDDGALAALCAGLIAILAVGVILLGLPGVAAGMILLVGCVVILAWSVVRALGR